MKKPVARPVKTDVKEPTPTRTPRAFEPTTSNDIVTTFEETPTLDETATIPKRRRSWLKRILFGTISILISLVIGLAAEQLIRDLFARYEWLGWFGLSVLALFVGVVLIVIYRETAAILRLRDLESLRETATKIHETDNAKHGKKLIGELEALYADRNDMARPRTELDANMRDLFDGSAMVETAERSLMLTLDNRAKALTAAAARRVAIVTAISPRALVDIAFVAWESFRLARAIAELYGARPGLFGSGRLMGAILGHLAVTGGVALGDSVVQQLVGHGLAAKVSTRLGEGLVNGLMTVRVGVAAMRVTRPLPFHALKQPVVMDFMADLAKLGSTEDK